MKKNRGLNIGSNIAGVLMVLGLYLYVGFRGTAFISDKASMPDGGQPIGLNLFFEFGDQQEVALLHDAIRNDPDVAKASQGWVSSRRFSLPFFRQSSIRVGATNEFFPLVEERVKSIVKRMHPDSEVDFRVVYRDTTPGI